MISEERLISAITDAPLEQDARRIYADWLEERGDARAEFLRLEAQLDSVDDDSPRRTELLKRLIDCVRTTDPHWLAIVCRRYDVVLKRVGKGHLDLIKHIRKTRGFPLLKAKQLVESELPVTLLPHCTRWEAQAFIDDFSMPPWDLFKGDEAVPEFEVRPAGSRLA